MAIRKGDTCYFVMNNRRVVKGLVKNYCGGIYTKQIGAAWLRLFETKKEAAAKLSHRDKLKRRTVYELRSFSGNPVSVINPQKKLPLSLR